LVPGLAGIIMVPLDAGLVVRTPGVPFSLDLEYYPHLLAHSTTGDVSSVTPSGPVLLVPLGSIEQHGPHLPLNTDAVIAERWAQATAPLVGNAVVAPTMAYGSSGEHQSFAGTLSIGTPVLTSVLIELVRSAAHSFAATVFMCGHGGNMRAVQTAVETMRIQGHRTTALFPTWNAGSLPDGLDHLDLHAGRVETSLMLYLAPDLVRLDRAEAGNEGDIVDLIEPMKQHGVGAVSPNGVLGNPAGASASEGRMLLEDLVSRNVVRVDQFISDC